MCYVKFSVRRTVFHIFDFKKCRDLEIRVRGLRGNLRSLKMSPFGREPMTSYWCSIATRPMTLSRVVSEIFKIEKYRDLDRNPVKSQSGSLKVVSFDRLVVVSY